MDDIADILTRWAETPRESFALATVVRTTGSTYRKPGARMLVAPDGSTTGMVSGGCLEREIAEHGQRVLRQGKPVLLNYDTRRLLGCNGSLDLLVEPVVPAEEQTSDHLFTTAQDCLARRHSLVATTVFETAGAAVREPLGTLPLLAEDGAVFSLAKDFPDQFRAEGSRLFHAGRPLERRYEVHGGEVSVLLDNVTPPVRLIICGGGPDVTPVATLASQIGWEVTVISHPTQDPPDLAPRCRLQVDTPEVAVAGLRPDSRTACVVMTHQYGRDLAWLSGLLPLGLRYVGLLGPRQRCRGILGTLISEVGFTDESALDALHSPVGLDIGADGPWEIALSIISEVKAVLSGREGGSLRNRQGAIHAHAVCGTAG